MSPVYILESIVLDVIVMLIQKYLFIFIHEAVFLDRCHVCTPHRRENSLMSRPREVKRLSDLLVLELLVCSFSLLLSLSAVGLRNNIYYMVVLQMSQIQFNLSYMRVRTVFVHLIVVDGCTL